MIKIYGYIVWLVATLFVVYAFCLNTAAAVFSEAIKATLHASDLGVSLAAGAFILAFSCLQIPAGYLLDRFNARFVVSAGVLMLAVGNLLIAYSDNFTMFILSNFIEGLGAAFSFVAAAVLISKWFSAKLFPVMFGMTQALSCIFAGIIHYVFTLALKTHTWNNIYLTLSFFGFALFLVTITVIKSPSSSPSRAPISLIKSLMSVLRSRQILLCCLAAGASFGVLLAFAGMWYLPITLYYNVPSLDAVMISGIIFVGIGVGTPLLGWVSNLVKSRVVVLHVTLVTGTMALLLGIYLPHFDSHTLMIIKLVSFLIGFLLSGSMLFYTIVSEIATDANRGVAIGLLNTAVFLSNTIMLFIPYLFITPLSGHFFTYLWILPFIVLISILTLYFIRDTYEQ